MRTKRLVGNWMMSVQLIEPKTLVRFLVQDPVVKFEPMLTAFRNKIFERNEKPKAGIIARSLSLSLSSPHQSCSSSPSHFIYFCLPLELGFQGMISGIS